MKASAPASSANLGPGFDALALALDLRCEVTVEEADRWVVRPEDPGGWMEAAAREMSDVPLAITVESEVPMGAGLGSSAAVVTSLVAAINRLQDRPIEPGALFEVVAQREGHPDNAAAAVYGGLVLAAPDGVRRLGLHPAWHPVVAVPNVTLPTAEARQALPESVPLDAAARTVSRALGLVEALRSGDVELMRSITPDELHEPYRIALRPVIGELLATARAAGGAFSAVSGAGPSVLTLTTADGRAEVAAALAKVEGTRVLTPNVAPDGVI